MYITIHEPRCKSRKRRVHISTTPRKKTPGEPGHTRDTRGHTGTRIAQTNLTTKPTHTNAPANWHPHRTTARRPDPRPTQQPQPRSRPLPAVDSEEAAPCEPDPAASRSQVKKLRGEPGHTLDTRETQITQTNLTVPTPAVHSFTTHQNVHSQAFTSKRHAGHIGRDRNSRHL